MKPTIISFYTSFYGANFVRYFRRPSNSNNKSFKIQLTVKTPKNLYLHVHRNSGHHPCYIQTYDRGLLGNLKRNNPKEMVFDRVYFDFDTTYSQAHEIKREIIKLRRHSLNYKHQQREELEEKLRTLVINKRIAEPAIKEAKDFSIMFRGIFGKEPILFFSGCKGCHAYTFFDPIREVNINRALSWFAEKVKEGYNYQTLDESVNKDAVSRLSRVPYSKHQLTGLTVVPFTLNDSYDEIIEKSINPQAEPFQKDEYLSTMGEHLQQIDPILADNEQVKENERKTIQNKTKDLKSISGVEDHRLFFRELLGPPESEHPDKEYIMYCCPFPDHEDNNPSFKVHRTNYECYGCGKKGNLARKKDYLEFKKFMGAQLNR